MKIDDKVKRLADDNNATLVVDDSCEVLVWELWLDDGSSWIESGSRVLCQSYGNSFQSWKREAYSELLESVLTGKG